MFEGKQFDFFVNFGEYKPRYLFVRLSVTSLTAVILIYIVSVTTPWKDLTPGNRVAAYLLTVAAFNSVLEINLGILRLFRKWQKLWSVYVQVFAVVVVTFFLALLWVVVAENVLDNHDLLKQPATRIVLVIGLLILVIHLLVLIISNLTKEWINSRREINELRQAKLLSDYNQLKDRLNPHFLFNNLSVLKSLIHFNPQAAEVFTENFTNVYRYMLLRHEQRTVTLEEEMKFLKSYIALHKERIGEGLQVNIQVNPGDLQKEIPPMALQLLVENAIKHNVANKNRPLVIDIFSGDGSIVVKNNLNRKETTYSTHTGLSALDAQYRLLAGVQIETIDDGSTFAVRAPLL